MVKCNWNKGADCNFFNCFNYEGILDTAIIESAIQGLGISINNQGKCFVERVVGLRYNIAWSFSLPMTERYLFASSKKNKLGFDGFTTVMFYKNFSVYYS